MPNATVVGGLVATTMMALGSTKMVWLTIAAPAVFLPLGARAAAWLRMGDTSLMGSSNFTIQGVQFPIPLEL